MHVTANGVEIKVGLRVFTNDWSWGTVIEAPGEYDQGWWRVKIDDDAKYCAGRVKSYDGQRLTAQHPDGEPDPHPVLHPVEAFLKARPHYKRSHVEDIALIRTNEGVPFCRECNDWHHPDDLHSM